MAGAIDVKQTDSEKSTSILETGPSTSYGVMDGSNWTVNLAGKGSTQSNSTTAGNAAIPKWIWIAAAGLGIAAVWALWKSAKK